MSLTIDYRISPTPSALAMDAAEFITFTIQSAVALRGRARIALSGGNTPRETLALLADPTHHFLERIPWPHLDLYFVDERCVLPTDPDSNYRMIRQALLDPLRHDLEPHQSIFPPSRVHRIEAELAPEVAAARYESELRNSFRLEGAETPTFDLVLLGMGEDGHTASIFPSTDAVYNLTDLVTVNQITADHIPHQSATRITLTWPVINQARTVFFLISGAAKAEVLARVLTGPRNPELLPSQLIRPAGGILTILLDQAAASCLPAPTEQNHGLLTIS
jgi:6-phosphogluconolactonase